MSVVGDVSSLRRIMVPDTLAFPGYPSGVVVDSLLFMSGVRCLASRKLDYYDDLPAAVDLGRQGFWLAERDEERVAVDGWAAHDAMDRVLAAVGSTERDLLRLRIWQEDKRFFPAYERVRTVRQPIPSPSSGHAAGPELGIGGRSIGLDGVAVVHDRPGPAFDDHHPVVRDPGAAPYAVLAQHRSYTFMAGLTPVRQEAGFPTVLSYDDVPENGRRFATGRSHTDSRNGPIAAQTWYIYDKIRRYLEPIGADLRDVVHCLVALRDVRDVAMFHRVHLDMFGEQGPALTIVGAGEVGHSQSRVYIEPTIYTGASDAIAWPGPPPVAAPLSRIAGRLIFLSGVLPIAKGRGSMRSIMDLDAPPALLAPTVAEFRNEPFVTQCWQVWVVLQAALERSGSSLASLVKITVFIADAAYWPSFEAVRWHFIAADLPAMEALIVPHPGPYPECLVQIDAIAAVS